VEQPSSRTSLRALNDRPFWQFRDLWSLPLATFDCLYSFRTTECGVNSLRTGKAEGIFGLIRPDQRSVLFLLLLLIAHRDEGVQLREIKLTSENGGQFFPH
jgi:hypothetical protein